MIAAYENSTFGRLCRITGMTVIPVILGMLSLTIPQKAMAIEPEPEPVFYETSVFVVVQGIGGAEISAVINNDSAYLSVTDLFNFLKIKNVATPHMDSVYGFFITEKAPFLIDKKNSVIRYGDKLTPLNKNDIVGTEASIYLSTGCLANVFGLTCQFSFRSLSVKLETRQELPAIREMRQEMMRRNISRLKGELKADTIIGPRHPMFSIGTADWSVIATQRPETKANAGIGGDGAGRRNQCIA